MYDFRPKVNVTLTQTGEVFPCAIGESLLRGMLRLGRKGIPVGCVNGGCGICKVRVTGGAVESLGPISRAHVGADEEREGFTLACRVGPKVDVKVEVVGKMHKGFAKGHATASTAAVAGSVSTPPTPT